MQQDGATEEPETIWGIASQLEDFLIDILGDLIGGPCCLPRQYCLGRQQGPHFGIIEHEGAEALTLWLWKGAQQQVDMGGIRKCVLLPPALERGSCHLNRLVELLFLGC